MLRIRGTKITICAGLPVACANDSKLKNPILFFHPLPMRNTKISESVPLLMRCTNELAIVNFQAQNYCALNQSYPSRNRLRQLGTEELTTKEIQS